MAIVLAQNDSILKRLLESAREGLTSDSLDPLLGLLLELNIVRCSALLSKLSIQSCSIIRLDTLQTIEITTKRIKEHSSKTKIKRGRVKREATERHSTASSLVTGMAEWAIETRTYRKRVRG